jgi:hypothetical protein
MQPKSPAFREMSSPEEREQRIGDFIRQTLAASADTQPILLVARSASSPAARAVGAVVSEMTDRQVEVRMIVGSDEWDLGLGMTDHVSSDVRIARNPRLLHAHEQIVVGDHATWFGDSMRRDPLKRDAYECFTAHDPAGARMARSTFEKLWQSAEPHHGFAPERIAAAMQAGLSR